MFDIPYQYILFTDSSYKDVSGIGYCGYGVVILNTTTMKFTEFGDFIGDRTIAYGELWAIYQAISRALKIIGKKREAKILVVSDSKLCVNGFSLYIPKKWDLSDWHNWKTIKNKPVKNQAIYRKTLETMSKYPKVTVRIAHMHGHMSKRNGDKIKRDLRLHGINADDATVQLFRDMNSRVDEIAGSAVERQIRLSEQFGDVPILCRTEFLVEE